VQLLESPRAAVNLPYCRSLEQAIDRHPLTVSPEALLVDVIWQMSQVEDGNELCRQPQQVAPQSSCVLVVHEQQLLGLLTERDVVQWVATGRPLAGVLIAEAMTRQVVTLTVEQMQDGSDALEILCQRQIHHLPIVDAKNQLQGLVNFDRLCRVMQPQLKQQLQQEVSERRIEQAILHQVEDALQETQRMLWGLISNLPGMIYRRLTDSDWTIRFVSEGCFDLTGYLPEDLMDNRRISLQQLTHPDDWDRVLEQIKTALEANQPFQLAYRILTASGAEKWLWEQGQGIFDANGNVVALEGFIFDITDRQRVRQERDQTQAALQKSEATNRALLAAIPDLMIRLSRDGTYLDCLPAKDFRTMMADLQGKNLFEVMPLAIAQQRMHYIQQALTTGKTQIHEFEVVVDGQTHDRESRITMLGQDEVLAIVRDISERKRAERALRESEERFKSLVVSIPGAVYRCQADADWTGDFISDFIEVITGYPASDFHNNRVRTWTSVVCPDDQERCRKTVTEAIAAHEPFTLEYQLIHRDGGLRWVHEQGQAIFDHGGNPVRLEGVIFDISDRKRAEAKRKRVKADLQKAKEELEMRVQERTAELLQINQQLQQEIVERQQIEARFRRVVDSNMIGIFFADANAQITDANEAFLAIVGYTYQDLKADQMNWRAMVPPEYLGFSQQVDRELQQFGVSSTYEKELVRKNGTRVAVLVGIALMEDDEHPGSDVTFVLDITNRKEAEQQLKASLSEKDLLLKEVHHRVKNNMQVISSIFSLQAQYLDDSATLSVLEECQQRIRSMALIHEKLYQCDSVVKIDFADYIQSLAANLFAFYRVDRSLIRFNLQVSNVTLTLDAAIPCGLLLNELVSNALKHAFPQQAGEITIQLSIDTEQHLHLVVRDNGVGLSKNSTSQQTNSLGLRLVRALTRQLQGRLEINSNQGTAFEIVFPQPREHKQL
jgi:PAS domain S-box-containing protein